ncbi:hypothetical protein LJB87_02290 [Alistipes sp. OttesenSCG-928-L06]|nr:hypothetical protein [Alistipes sp. OttesenSCG-928-L06]
MKSNGTPRVTTDSFGPEDTLRKAAKLPPLKKSGKEKQSFYREMEEDDDDFDLKSLHKRESVLDYYDDNDEDTEDEWEEMDEDDADDLDEDWEEEWTEDEEEEDWED